jgi:hypothetical protein
VEEKDSGGRTVHKVPPAAAATIGATIGRSQTAVNLSMDCSCTIILELEEEENVHIKRDPEAG